MADEWEKLIKRYADKKHIPCNCKQAYYKDGSVTYYDNMDGIEKPLGVCEYGCQANQYAVKDYIAKKVLKELKE
jgi:hypothetical protein